MGRWTTAATIAALAAFSCGQARANPPVEAFAHLPTASDPSLSPDGKHVVVMQQVAGRPAAVVYETSPEPGAKPVVLALDSVFITGANWVTSDRLVVTVKFNTKADGDLRVQSYTRAITVGADGKNPVILFKNNPMLDYNYAGGTILGRDQDDPRVIYVQLYNYALSADASLSRDARHLDVYKVDAYSGDTTIIAYGTDTTIRWYMDGHGHVVGRLDRTKFPLSDHLMVRDGDNGWKEVASFDATAGGEAFVEGLNGDGTQMIIARNVGGRNALVPLDIRTGQSGAPLFTDPHFDADAPLFDFRDGSVIGVSYDGDKTEDHYFDPQWARLQKGLEQAFPGESVRAVFADATLNLVVVRTNSPKKAIRYYLLNRTTHEASELAEAYPELQESDLGEMKPYPYTARDGLDIPAYLTLPPGVTQAKRLPLVVFPHGGPEFRNTIGFDWWAQFMANRGYAVFQPNFRGSAGYGIGFVAKAFHQYGRAMQDDITDGVKKLIADGIVDPGRVCIVGASYGGYAALAGAAFTPDLYRCAISFAGISDLRKELAADERDRGRESATMSYLKSRVGDRYDDDDALDAVSPALHADNVKIPILLIHGKNDTTVRVAQSIAMRDALANAGKPVTYIEIDGEDHYLNLAATRIQVLTEIEKFLKANIGN